MTGVPLHYAEGVTDVSDITDYTAVMEAATDVTDLCVCVGGGGGGSTVFNIIYIIMSLIITVDVTIN